MRFDELAKQGYEIKDGKIVKKRSGKSKYRNTSIIIDGITFHSTKEGNYYTKLKLLKKAKQLKNFKRQVKYEIKVNNIHIADYYLDFEVEYNDGSIEYIDIKGLDKETKKWITTGVFELKKKLVEAIYGIKIIKK